MRTLLITDDQEGVLHTLGYVFGEHGYRTLLARSGAAALEIARAMCFFIFQLQLAVVRAKQPRQRDSEDLGEGERLVIENRAAARFDFGDLRTRQHHAELGEAPAQILLRNSGLRSQTELFHFSSNQVAGMGWFFALQHVPYEHIDLIRILIVNGACGAHSIRHLPAALSANHTKHPFDVPSAMRTLLITDDQEGVLHTLGYVFGEHGYRTLLARSGATALEIARAERVDAALVDLHMPAMDGFAVCRSLAEVARDSGRALPVWLMTGAWTAAAAAQAAEVGARALLKKPFDSDELVNDLERFFAATLPIPAAVLAPGQREATQVA
jgi:CheY-like chemotaxis protein